MAKAALTAEAATQAANGRERQSKWQMAAAEIEYGEGGEGEANGR